MAYSLNTIEKHLADLISKSEHLVSKNELQGIKIDNLILKYKVLEGENEKLKSENSDLREKLAAAQEQIRLAQENTELRRQLAALQKVEPASVASVAPIEAKAVTYFSDLPVAKISDQQLEELEERENYGLLQSIFKNLKDQE